MSETALSIPAMSWSSAGARDMSWDREAMKDAPLDSEDAMSKSAALLIPLSDWLRLEESASDWEMVSAKADMEVIAGESESESALVIAERSWSSEAETAMD